MKTAENTKGAEVRITKASSEFEIYTAPFADVMLQPGNYEISVFKDGFHPQNFEISAQEDDIFNRFVALEPIIAGLSGNLRVGTLEKLEKLKILDVQADFDNDGAPDAVILENDTILVYSHVQKRTIWQPITLVNLGQKKIFTLTGDFRQ